MTGGWGTPTWMSPSDPVIGETFVAGKTTEVARTLLTAARAVGIDPQEVRAVNGGFIVPDAVWDHVQTDQADF